jgi:nitrogen fixation protein FixH
MRKRPGTGTIADARARLQEAAASAEAAVPATDPDAITSHAIAAALAAADAICCIALRERPADDSRQAAVELLGRVDKKLSSALQRALDRQAQAANESRDISLSDARMCLRQAEFLLEAARDRVLSA